MSARKAVQRYFQIVILAVISLDLHHRAVAGMAKLVDEAVIDQRFDIAAGAVAAAQQTTAAISRYLALVGVDPALWLHALDTRPDRLYYFSAQELTDLKLVTNVNE